MFLCSYAKGGLKYRTHKTHTHTSLLYSVAELEHQADTTTTNGTTGRDCRMSWTWQWARLIRRLVLCIEQDEQDNNTKCATAADAKRNATLQQQRQYTYPRLRRTSRRSLVQLASFLHLRVLISGARRAQLRKNIFLNNSN